MMQTYQTHQPCTIDTLAGQCIAEDDAMLRPSCCLFPAILLQLYAPLLVHGLA